MRVACLTISGMYQSRAPWVKLISTTMMPILPTFFTHSNPLLLTVFYIQLVASLLGAAHASSGCDNPAQRKEWRMLSGAEKQSWVDAFNVSVLYRLSISDH